MESAEKSVSMDEKGWRRRGCVVGSDWGVREYKVIGVF
jgi:hypothetical protein